MSESSDENQRKLEDYPTMDDKDENPLKSSGGLIQEVKELAMSNIV